MIYNCYIESQISQAQKSGKIFFIPDLHFIFQLFQFLMDHSSTTALPYAEYQKWLNRLKK